MSSDESTEAHAATPPELSRGRKLFDTVVWIVIPVASTIALAIKYWPR